MTTEINIFDTPQGNLAGVAIEMASINGRSIRIAHSYIMTDEPASITLSLPKKVSLSELKELTDQLAGFVSKMEKISESHGT